MAPPPPPHPMVNVPDAIRTVLREACREVLRRQTTKNDNSGTGTNDDKTTEQIPLSKVTIGRVLAQDVVMPAPGYPPYAASVMDGYALVNYHHSIHDEAIHKNADEYDADAGPWWPIYGRALAGDGPLISERDRGSVVTPASASVSAYYVTTGGMVPPHCTGVIPVENVQVSDDGHRVRSISSATIQQHWKPDQWIRRAGCDIPSDTVVLEAGRIIDAVGVGLLCQAGVDDVLVERQANSSSMTTTVRVGVLSTGNELWSVVNNNDDNNTGAIEPSQHTTTTTTKKGWWKTMPPGCIPDVNRPVLMNFLASTPHVEMVDLGMVRDDDTDAMTAVLEAARCDVILTTGGVSMGETDVVEHVLTDRLGGTLHFGRLNMKPGKPTTFVTLPHSDLQSRRRATTLVFALPGNPVSAIVCTHLLVRPCLRVLTHGVTVSADTHGASLDEELDRHVSHVRVHDEVTVTLAHDIRLDAGRPEYHRVTVVSSTTSSTHGSRPVMVASTGVQRSSRLMSVRDAQGLVCLPRGTLDHPVALAGEQFVMLWFRFDGDDNNATCITGPQSSSPTVNESMHLAVPRTPLRVGIVQVTPPSYAKTDLPGRVAQALSGSKSGSVSVIVSTVYSDPLEGLYASLDEDAVDIWVVACPKFLGSFRYHVKLVSLLRERLSKVADTLALQARRGAAAQDPTSAVFEVVVGYGKGSIVIAIPEEGLDKGLSNVRGLLKHALKTARGRP